MNIPLATIRTQDDLIEALRVAKALRGLSNDFCDQRAGLTRGHVDKVLGPTRAKSLSPMVLDLLLEIFAVQLILVANPDAEARMKPRWEDRDTSNVRTGEHRVSKHVIERARHHVLKASGELGAVIRCQVLSPEDRTRIALIATETRWKKQGRKQTKRARQKRASYHRRKGMRARLKERKLAQMQVQL
jgi:hypothetical protein